MSQNHSTAKPGRRPKNTRRRDWTRETAFNLRSAEATNLADRQENELGLIRDYDKKTAQANRERREAKRLAQQKGNR